MTAFQLDTSGFVEVSQQGMRTKRIYWKDLTPFTQGYIEALFAGLFPPDDEERAAVRAKRGWVCNFTGGHCPSGCGSPCSQKTDRSLVGGAVEVTDYNRTPAFSDLAPETIARIIEDCASFENFTSGLGFKTGAVEGRRFWNGRAAKLLTGAWAAAFPPLSPYLGGDGKVYLREADQ